MQPVGRKPGLATAVKTEDQARAQCPANPRLSIMLSNCAGFPGILAAQDALLDPAMRPTKIGN